MFFLEYNYGKTQSIWAETTENWDEAHPSWKIVGHNPRRILRSDFGINNTDMDLCDIFLRSSIEHMFDKDDCYYLAIYSSGRTCVTTSSKAHESGTYVIIEADRGEDCVQIKERIPSSRLPEYGNKPETGKQEKQEHIFKNILRIATRKDIEILDTRRLQETSALEKCDTLVSEMGLPMDITGCEYQWDMKKITFYFRSSKRVDFRELVKELFKYFKIRIWMSMENRKDI